MAEQLTNRHNQQGTTSSSSVEDLLCNSSDSLEYKSTWYYSRKDLENNSPSKKDGIDWKRENELRASYCRFIQNMGMKFRVPQLTIATAIMFCHRFYLRQSHSRNNWEIIATVSIFLASKVEETPLSLDKVIVAAYEMIHKNNTSSAQRIHSKDFFAKQKELILMGERLLLSTIGFDFNVQHPYMPLVATIKKFKLQHDLMKIAWNFVNDWLQTTLCLQYKPHYIAAGSLYLAAKISKVQLPSQPGSSWYYEFDVVPCQLKEVIERMMLHIGSKQADDLPCTQGKEVTTSSPDSVITQAAAVSSSPVSTVNQNLSSNQIPAGSSSSNAVNTNTKPKLDLEAIRAKVKRRRLERDANKLGVSDNDLTKDTLEREIESGIE